MVLFFTCVFVCAYGGLFSHSLFIEHLLYTGSVLSALFGLAHFIITTALCGRFFDYPHFTGGEAETQSWWAAEPGLDPRHSGSRAHAISMFLISTFYKVKNWKQSKRPNKEKKRKRNVLKEFTVDPHPRMLYPKHVTAITCDIWNNDR